MTINLPKAFKSLIDQSVNFVTPTSDGGYLESRYVRRAEDYFICYLSSQSGCNKGCQMCHLTSTGQTMFKQASRSDFETQAYAVFDHYRTQPEARVVHFNWMARGEALANPDMLQRNQGLFTDLMAQDWSLIPKFNISTIMPKTLKQGLSDIFKGITPTIYYSLYSLRQDFRDKWLPGAMDCHMALDNLKDYQQTSKKIIKLHYALIAGENDDPSNCRAIFSNMANRRLVTELNLVRYNSPGNSSESGKYDEYLRMWRSLGGTGKIVERVGEDVKASCGMFVS